MKFDQRSIANLTSVLGIIFLCTLSSCRSKPTLEKEVEEVSLKDDRGELDDLRKSIPPEKRKENDELALMLRIMADKTQAPSNVRTKFFSFLRKKREEFSRAQRLERDKFNQEERSNREKFLRDLREQRDAYYRKSVKPEEKRRFNHELNDKRDRFFSETREKRMSFEEDYRAKSKNFEAMVMDRTNEFNEHLREYSKNYDEAKKQKEKVSAKPPAIPAEEIIPEGMPAKKLETDDK